MWHTADGDRVLRGAEAKVFAEGLLDLAQNELVDDGESRTGIPVFDSLTYPQKITILNQVAQAIFREEVPIPELTAVLEGAVGAVFQVLRSLVEQEVEAVPDHDKSLRDLVSMACRIWGLKKCPVRRIAVSMTGDSAWTACMMPSCGTATILARAFSRTCLRNKARPSSGRWTSLTDTSWRLLQTRPRSR